MIFFLRVSSGAEYQWIRYRMTMNGKPSTASRPTNAAKVFRNDNDVLEILAQPHDREYTVQALTKEELLDVRHFESADEQGAVVMAFNDMMTPRDAGPVRFTSKNIQHFFRCIDYCTGKEIRIEE